MKRSAIVLISSLIIFASLFSFALGRQQNQPGFILERDADIGVEQPGPHQGGGTSVGYNFFAKAPGLKMVFRKRVLKPGAAIGYHLQKSDEIFYILSGSGIMQMNGENFAVKPGDAILTRPGNSHGLQQSGEEDLVLMINYMAK